MYVVFSSFYYTPKTNDDLSVNHSFKVKFFYVVHTNLKSTTSFSDEKQRQNKLALSNQKANKTEQTMCHILRFIFTQAQEKVGLHFYWLRLHCSRSHHHEQTHFMYPDSKWKFLWFPCQDWHQWICLSQWPMLTLTLTLTPALLEGLFPVLYWKAGSSLQEILAHRWSHQEITFLFLTGEQEFRVKQDFQT